MTIEELKTKSVMELKAMVYDSIATIELNQQNIKVLNEIIADKSKKEKAEGEK